LGFLRLSSVIFWEDIFQKITEDKPKKFIEVEKSKDYLFWFKIIPEKGVSFCLFS